MNACDREGGGGGAPSEKNQQKLGRKTYGAEKKEDTIMISQDTMEERKNTQDNGILVITCYLMS